jgi:multimeric flavodoxin WrbA
MKVVAFDGSKEPRGPVGTRVALIVDRLLELGIDAEVVRLEKVRRTGCTVCGQCGHRTGDLACAGPPEDGLRRCVRKLREADAVLIGTPAYGSHSSPATQALLLRLDHDRRERGDTRLAGKPAAVVVGPRVDGAAAVGADVRRRLEAHGVDVLDVLVAGAGEEGAGAGVEAVASVMASALAARLA